MSRTQRDLERLTLPAGKAEAFHFDARCPGLSVRIQRTGKPAFVTWYTVGGKRRGSLSVRSPGSISIRRDGRPTEIVNAGRDGRDPGQRAQACKIAAADVLTVGGLIGAYLREHAERHQRPRTLIETRRALERHWRPCTASRRATLPAASLGPAARAGAFHGTRGRQQSTRAPVCGVRLGHEGGAGRPQPGDRHRQGRGDLARTRAFDWGAGAIWHATARLSGYDAIVCLLMLTGQRKAEIGGLAWAELDRANAMVLLPVSDQERRAHEVPLSRQALAIIDEFPQFPACPTCSAVGDEHHSAGGRNQRRGLTPGSQRSKAPHSHPGSCMTSGAQSSPTWPKSPSRRRTLSKPSLTT